MSTLGLLTLLASLVSAPGEFHTSHFAGTDHRLDVYVRRAEEPGRTVLVLGGIHGNERGAYLAAEALTRLPISRGTLIVIPHVNQRAIGANLREVDGDMNRKFSQEDPPSGVDAEIVSVLKSYISEADLLLNLHDGWGFYDTVYRNDLRNPSRFGQTVIADCREFFSPKYAAMVPLQDPAEDVLRRINPGISHGDELFHFWNHATSDPRTLHPEMRKSATYYAVTQCGIPAFGVETSQNLRTDAERVRYQLMVVQEFLRIYGLEPGEMPRIDRTMAAERNGLPGTPARVQPESQPAPAVTVAYEVNGIAGRIAVGQELRIVAGDHLRFLRDPAIRVNVIGFVSDPRGNTGKDNGFLIDTAQDLIRKHSAGGAGRSYAARLFRGVTDVGSVTIVLAEPVLKAVLVTTAEGPLRLQPGQVLDVPSGAHLTVTAIEANVEAGVQVNVVGFRGRGDGEDRGLEFSTDGLLSEYSIDRKGGRYPIRVSRYGRLIGEVYLEILKEDPQQ